MRRDLLEKLIGVQDSRSKIGILARGNNIYRGGSTAAHRGGGVQYGRPSKDAIARRMRRR